MSSSPCSKKPSERAPRAVKVLIAVQVGPSRHGKCITRCGVCADLRAAADAWDHQHTRGVRRVGDAHELQGWFELLPTPNHNGGLKYNNTVPNEAKTGMDRPMHPLGSVHLKFQVC